jgi:hypothetical protein
MSLVILLLKHVLMVVQSASAYRNPTILGALMAPCYLRGYVVFVGNKILWRVA